MHIDAEAYTQICTSTNTSASYFKDYKAICRCFSNAVIIFCDVMIISVAIVAMVSVTMATVAMVTITITNNVMKMSLILW